MLMLSGLIHIGSLVEEPTRLRYEFCGQTSVPVSGCSSRGLVMGFRALNFLLLFRRFPRRTLRKRLAQEGPSRRRPLRVLHSAILVFAICSIDRKSAGRYRVNTSAYATSMQRR